MLCVDMPMKMNKHACNRTLPNRPACTTPSLHLAQQVTDAHAMQVASENAYNSVHAAHERLRNRHSDALSALNALIVFESQDHSKADSFCKKHFLHAPGLREMAALHAQLTRMIAEPGLASARHKSAGLLSYMAAVLRAHRQTVSRPGETLGRALRRCIAAGWADQIGKRVRSQQHLANLKQQVRLLLSAWPTSCRG
jgi:hypothetical protein